MRVEAFEARRRPWLCDEDLRSSAQLPTHGRAGTSGARTPQMRVRYVPAKTVQCDDRRQAVLRPRAARLEAVHPPVAEGEGLRLERCHGVVWGRMHKCGVGVYVSFARAEMRGTGGGVAASLRVKEMLRCRVPASGARRGQVAKQSVVVLARRRGGGERAQVMSPRLVSPRSQLPGRRGRAAGSSQGRPRPGGSSPASLAR